MSANQGSLINVNSCSSGKNSLIGMSEDGAFGNLDMWSATTLSAPFLSLILKLNSCKSSIYRINLALASFFASKYLKVAWSVKTVTVDPIRYCLNYSSAKITAKNSFSVVE